MLRVHLTGADLARVVLAWPLPEAGEAAMAAQLTKRSDQKARYGSWRAGLRGRIPVTARPLLDLIPAHGWVPDFLTPFPQAVTLQATTEAILRTTPQRLTAQLNRLTTVHRFPGWVSTYAAGDQEAAHAVARALAALYNTAILPHLARAQAIADSEQARVTDLLTHGGVGPTLARPHPALRWEPPVLMLPSPRTGDVHLSGRGLVLAPMVFCGPRPRLWLGDGTAPALLAYATSIDHLGGDPFAHQTTAQAPSTALSKLPGATRAKLLHLIVTTPGLPTTTLAGRAGVSPASASEHATNMRQTGLITTHPDGRRVRHYPSDQGAALAKPR